MKPIWHSYSHDPQDIEKLIHYMPSSMRKLIKHSIPNIDEQAKLAFGVNTLNSMELPKFEQGTKLTCPGSTTVGDVIKFISGKVNFEKFIICNAVEYDPVKYVELTMVVKSSDGKDDEHIILDNDL
jgi:hypothetical protein